MSKKTANWLCLLVACIWGGGFLATGWSLETFDPFWTLVFRFCGAALLGFLPLAKERPAFSRRAARTGVCSGVFLYVAFAFQTFGLKYTSAGMNAFLTSVNVVFVPWLAWLLLRQKVKAHQVLASFLCLAGIGLLSLQGGVAGFSRGDLYTLVCAFFFACQIVVLGFAGKENPFVINFVQMAVAGIISIPCALCFEAFPSKVPPLAWISLAYSACISTWLAFQLQTYAQKYTTPAAASILLGTESLWANVFAVAILHDPVSLSLLGGGALILASVFLTG